MAGFVVWKIDSPTAAIAAAALAAVFVVGKSAELVVHMPDSSWQ